MAELPGSITDARICEGILTCQVVGTSVPGKPTRKSCIAVFCDVDYTWLGDPRAEPLIAEDGRRIDFPTVGQSISLEEIIENAAAIWFLRWARSGFLDLPLPQQLAGCWRTGTGLALLHSSGMARFITVGKGPASDDGGEWVWRPTKTHEFVIEKLDAPSAKATAYRQECRLSRYDGRILELVCRSGFNLHAEGLCDIRYWQREKKYPKLWEKWA